MPELALDVSIVVPPLGNDKFPDIVGVAGNVFTVTFVGADIAVQVLPADADTLTV